MAELSHAVRASFFADNNQPPPDHMLENVPERRARGLYFLIKVCPLSEAGAVV